MTDTPEVDQYDGTEIAIIGMAVRVPGATDVDAYWSNLRDGVESVRMFSDDELDAAGVPESLRRQPGFIPAGGPLDSAKAFDPTLFGLSPRDASIMDPQHRHFVEASWEALEHAGYDPSRFDGAIGVYAGSGHNAYMPLNLMSNPSLVDSVGFFLLRHTSNDKDFMATRVSYLFDLKGPAINVQTACSTSLVAAHLGVQSLLNMESDMVLAGGATIEMPLNQGYVHQEGEILSADGHCRAFDADSSGTVFGSGAGVVVLKRLDDALDDGDTIHAIIRASAINNDGSGKVGYLAPSVDGQAAAVGEAIALADIDPETIGFIECHGTGTEIGDPIEIAALTEAFRAHTQKTGFCAVGSVKTNIGHLDTAAGVASLVKAGLAVKHGEVPPTLHYQAPNPRIDFESSPFFVNNERIEWPVADAPRRAGVSSLGVGGTNAHIIVEEPPAPAATDVVDGWQILPLSAKGPTALDEMTANLAAHLAAGDDDLADVAFTLQEGRQALDVRRYAVVRDHADAVGVLQGDDPQRLLTGTAAPKERPIVFMFPGQGAQYPGMGKGLYADHAVFRDAVDECARILEPHLGFDLREVLFPAPDAYDDAAERLAQTALTQPAIFTIEYATAQLLMSWGLTPTALIGHSIGEYVAACLSGVFSLNDGLTLVATRGALMQDLPAGSMLAVPQPAASLESRLTDGLSLAARNAPDFSVVAGPDSAVDALQAALDAEDVAVSRLRTSHAFHSEMMEPMLAPFRDAVAATTRNEPTIPFVSNVTGTWITAAQCADPDYWSGHVRSAVDFAGGLETVLAVDPDTALVEVGPGRTLATFAKQTPGPHGAAVTTSIRHPNADVDDTATALAAIGHLWAIGSLASWDAVRPAGRRRRVPLPTYPFQHEDYWVEPGTQVFDGLEERSLEKRPDITDWFHVPAWTQAEPSGARLENGAGPWLVFVDDTGIGDQVVEALGADGPVATVRRGIAYDVVGGRDFTIDPTDVDHYRRLLAELGDDLAPRSIAYLWPLAESADLAPGSASMRDAQTMAFTAPLLLAQTLGLELTDPLTWWVVTNRMRTVAGDTTVHPEQALVAGAIPVIMHENPLITARSVDIEWPERSPRRIAGTVGRLVDEFTREPSDPIVAYRGPDRWIQHHESLPIPPSDDCLIREGGVYLITGGSGGLGLELGDHLARTAGASVVLVGRTPVPDPDEWAAWLDRHPDNDRTSRLLRRLEAIETTGGTVTYAAADVTDADRMAAIVADTVERHGRLDGVFHAAGALDDGLIAMKTPADAAAVLAPKVTGTLAVEHAIADADVDFLVLFSSVSALTCPPGQIDYAAANAFLDAYAQRAMAELDRVTVAVGWGPWQDVGMTLRTAVEQGLVDDESSVTEVAHSLIDRWYPSSVRDVFELDVSTERQWLLDEHRGSDGTAIMPGTGYLDILRAVQHHRSPQSPGVEISDVFFMAPLMLGDGESARVRVEVEADHGFSLSTGGTDHVRGRVRALDASPPPKADLDAIRARCTDRQVEYDRYDHQHLRWGPRWDNLRAIGYGPDEAFATLQLPGAFVDDLDEHPLHPAVLDLATAGAQDLIAGLESDDDFFVPFSYGRLRQYAALTPTVHSSVRSRPASDSETGVFDVTVYGPDGAVLVEIESFVMRRATGEIAAAAATDAPADDAPVDPLLESLNNGIALDEGMEALRRLLTLSARPVVTTVAQDLLALLQRTQTAAAAGDAGTGISHARPDLSTAYVEPETERELAVAAIWEEMLGVEGIGVHDDFFELGGHSLLLTQAITRIKKLTTADISLASLFEASTISQIAAELDDAEGEADAAESSDTAAPTLGRVSRDGFRTSVGALHDRDLRGSR